jgi:pimeloyl-ACP methyl ester carboxylesterase
MKKLIAIVVQLFLTAAASAVTITEQVQVPGLTDLTATYQFTSDQEGTILYGGSCGNGDLTEASVGSNTVTWALTEGTYSDCTVTVDFMGESSNTLRVPPFTATDKYPVIFVHGLFGDATLWTCSGCAIDYLAGEGWERELLVARSISDDCIEYGGTFNCNNVLCDPTQPRIVAGWIDDVLSRHPGFEQVDLVGHSRGGMNMMTGLWYGDIDPRKVRNAVTMSGANRPDVFCPRNNPFPPIPDDETPGGVLYTVYWSNCDKAVGYDGTYVGDGAYMEDLSAPDGICLNHSGMRTDAVALAAMYDALLSSPPANAAPPPQTVTKGGGGGGCFITTTF